MCSSMNACKRRCRSLVLSLNSKFIVGVLCVRRLSRGKRKSTLLKSLVLRITDGFEIAIDATRLAGDAYAATVPDELMAEVNPYFFGDDAHQVLLDFLGVLVLGEIEAAREANHVSVDHDAAGDAVGRAQHHVRRFSSDAGKGKNLVHGLGDLTPEVFEEGFAGAHDRLGLVAEEAGWANFLLQFAGIGIGEGLGIGIFLVERFGDLIYTHVGALRGKNRGDQELKRIFVR